MKRYNMQNLRPIRSTERARELGRRGGLASGVARRQRKQIRNDVRYFLLAPLPDRKEMFEWLITLI